MRYSAVYIEYHNFHQKKTVYAKVHNKHQLAKKVDLLVLMCLLALQTVTKILNPNKYIKFMVLDDRCNSFRSS